MITANVINHNSSLSVSFSLSLYIYIYIYIHDRHDYLMKDAHGMCIRLTESHAHVVPDIRISRQRMKAYVRGRLCIPNAVARCQLAGPAGPAFKRITSFLLSAHRRACIMHFRRRRRSRRLRSRNHHRRRRKTDESVCCGFRYHRPR